MTDLRTPPINDGDLFSERARQYALEKPLQRIHILEAGCGWGTGLDLGDREHHVTGVDMEAPELRAYTCERPDLDAWHLGDLRTVPLPPRAYDVVHASYLIERVPHAELVLDRFVAALKPGGLLLVHLRDRNTAFGFLDRTLPRWMHASGRKRRRLRAGRTPRGAHARVPYTPSDNPPKPTTGPTPEPTRTPTPGSVPAPGPAPETTNNPTHGTGTSTAYGPATGTAQHPTHGPASGTGTSAAHGPAGGAGTSAAYGPASGTGAGAAHGPAGGAGTSAAYGPTGGTAHHPAHGLVGGAGTSAAYGPTGGMAHDPAYGPAGGAGTSAAHGPAGGTAQHPAHGAVGGAGSAVGGGREVRRGPRPVVRSGPPAAIYDRVASRSGLQWYCVMRGLVISEEYTSRQAIEALGAGTGLAEVLCRLVSALTRGRLTADHSEVTLVIRKPENRFARVI